MTVARSPTQRLDFHGLSLEIEAPAAVLRALDARLGRFAISRADEADLRFVYREHVALDESPRQARVVYESPMGRALYEEALDRMFIESVWPVRADVHPSQGEVVISTAGAASDSLWPLAHPMFTLPLIESLKRKGLFSVHAAGLAHAGKGLLIAGSSGAGKSTLALALAAHGFQVQGDDMLFLARREGELHTLAFPEAFDLTDASLALFPELAGRHGAAKPAGWPKHQLHVDARLGAEITWDARPRVLLFPKVANAPRSELLPMDRAAALLELAPNILLTDAQAGQAHLDALGALVARCSCYRLLTGQDFATLASRLRDLLEQAP